MITLRVLGIEEHVAAVEIEKAHVHVHAATRGIGEGLGHEGGVHAVLHGDLLHHQLVGHDRISHGESVGEAKVDLVLGRTVLVMAVLDGNAHLLQREHGIASQVAGVIQTGQVEIAAAIQKLGALGVLEVIELNLGADVEHVPHVLGLAHHARQHMARVAFEGLAVGRADTAEHTGDGVALRAPGKHLERGGVGERQHIGFLGTAEALDAAAVEAHAVGEGVFKLAGDDGERLHAAEHIGEPESHEVHIAAFNGFQNEILLRVGSHERFLLHAPDHAAARIQTSSRGRLYQRMLQTRYAPEPLRRRIEPAPSHRNRHTHTQKAAPKGGLKAVKPYCADARLTRTRYDLRTRLSTTRATRSPMDWNTCTSTTHSMMETIMTSPR